MRHRSSVEAHHFEALGTSCSLFGLGVTRSQLLQGEFWVRELRARITRFSDRSELALLNGAEGAWVDVSAEMEALLWEALRAYELSAGLVNAARAARPRASPSTHPPPESACSRSRASRAAPPH